MDNCVHTNEKSSSGFEGFNPQILRKNEYKNI